MKPFISMRLTLLIASTLYLLGCGSGGTKKSTSQQSPLSIANGTQLTVACGQSVSLSAGYGLTGEAHVVWSQTPPSASLGGISPSGLYTAPIVLSTDQNVTITATDPDTQQSASTVISIVNPIPSISNVFPSTFALGVKTIGSVDGVGFQPNATVVVDGKAIPTTYLSPISLSFSFIPSNWTSAGSVLTVVNAAPGGGSSNSASLTYNLPAISYDAAARFLEQATWGATPSQIKHVQAIGFSSFIDEQLANSPKSYLTDNDGNHFEENFWAQITGNDSTQLRTKTAWAWYKLFNSPGSTNLAVLTAVPETLNRDAFANFSSILTDISFNIEMGMYLNYCCWDPSGPQPDENFSREIMQQFTIGPHLLNGDGSPILGTDGNPAPSYSAQDIEGIARAVTGLTYTSDVWSNNDTEGLIPMIAGSQHDFDEKTVLGTTIASGQDAKSELLTTINILSNHPNTGVRLSTYLIHEFVTSNPSSEYVARVSRVWANDGNGVKGNIPAVLKTILLDPEARAGDNAPSSQPVAFGRFRDTANFAAAFIRGMGSMPNFVISFGAPWQLSIQSHEMIFYAPSVFGYYSDNFAIPNTTTLAPEMQLYTTDTITARATFLYDILYIPPGVYPLISNIDWTQWTPQVAGDGTALIDYINHLWFHGSMSMELYSALQQNLDSIPASDPVSRVKQTIYLAMISPEFAVER
jgi:uncharacterized protein (DUF1800 family)/archaellum component FlaG (FlaF/FlaG flagellin family)